MKRNSRMLALVLCGAMCFGCVGAAAAEAPVKDETVYVLAAADGSVQQVIVSDWLQNGERQDILTDASVLESIENVKGDETFTTGENGMVWTADGKDLYYQGTTDKELPVTMKVSGQLDGNTIALEELAGKSGHVVIRYDFENQCIKTARIGEQDVCIHVPFGVLTGMILDNDVFRNVQVTGGKLVNDGDRSFVVGLTFPGLKENLGLDVFADYLEISADVENFSLGVTVSVVTNELLNGVNTEALEGKDGLSDAVRQLAEAVTALTDGSNQLYTGIIALAAESQTLSDGVTSLSDGAAAAAAGAVHVDDGAGQLLTGASELSTGLTTLTANNEALLTGAVQTFQALLDTANAQLAAAQLPIPALTMENYAQVLDGAIAAAPNAPALPALKTSLDSYNTFYMGLNGYLQGVAAAEQGAAALNGGAAQLKTGTEQLSGGIAQLDAGAQQMEDGMPALIQGVTALEEGAGQLAAGMVQLSTEAMQKLTELFGEDVETLRDRLQASVDASREYQNFSGISEGMNGQVRFLYRTAEIR